ncbi:unnamed protein product [Ambrosiozyma monospora]|uniref:Unnamed protein product n=1 Tax=Ambrosiozyma monospora TaxID=43982 RepID=A0ACB5TCN2_AMBMO|nr:unnamed protein product [Ambrosiozyma monospora]
MNRKYRNEQRPRSGLLRGREFVMKDAYSFDIDSESALKSFELMNEVYYKIFKDFKLDFIKANADSGSIGGDLSYEWHFAGESGEDTLFVCDNTKECGTAANVEKLHPLRENGQAKVADEASARYMLSTEGDLVAVYYPKGRSLNLKFIESEDLVDLDPKWTDKPAAKVLDKFQTKTEDGTEMQFKNVVRLMDKQVQPGTKLPDFPIDFSRSRMTTFENLDLVEAQEGDSCPSCNGMGHLKLKKGIEVGHTFYLGTKYSEPLNASYIDRLGKRKFYEMGCYGIGVSRLVGAIADLTRDKLGLRWPAKIAPLQLTVITATDPKPEVTKLIERLQEQRDMLFEVDTSTLGMGGKLMKSKKLGIPLQMIIGENNFPLVEIELRGQRFPAENGEYEYLKKFEEKKDEWKWSIVEERGTEKHLVHIDFADQVVPLLLKDM